MKHKKYSKQLSRTSSMLLKRDSKQKAGYVSLRLNSKLTVLDLSHQGITSLDGIEIYKELEAIDLSTSSFSNFNNLLPLSNCKELKQINLLETPLNTCVNLPMRVASIVPHIQLVNGIYLGNQGFTELQQLQKDIGSRIAEFFMQKCKIGLEIMEQPKKIKHWGPLKQELNQLKLLLSNPQSQSHSLMDLNWELKSHLPLNSVSAPPCLPENQEQIASYLSEAVILKAAESKPSFVEKLLRKIEVLNEAEEQMITKQTIVAKQILKMELQNQWKAENQQDDTENKNHFTSAETALDSNDRYGFVHKLTDNMHFLLDQEYVEIVREVLVNECEFILQKISGQESQHETQLSGKQIKVRRSSSVDSLEVEQYSGRVLKDKEQFQMTKQLGRLSSKQFTFNPAPANIYNNPVILKNILSVLQNSISGLAFRRIREYRPKKHLERVRTIAEQALKGRVEEIYSFGLKLMIEKSDSCKEMQEILRKKKLKRLFLEWRKVKKRKLLMMKKLLKKKNKADQFMKLVCLTKWRMNTRAVSLQRMASQVLICRPKKDPLPASKKGLDLAYRRVKEETQLRRQLATGKY